MTTMLERIETRRIRAWRRYNGRPTRANLCWFVMWTVRRDEQERAEAAS